MTLTTYCICPTLIVFVCFVLLDGSYHCRSGKQQKSEMHVAFAHLDLGIGGAEQLVVNAALALIAKGHQVTIFTTHWREDHCFAATRGEGLLANRIVVAGDWLPRSIGGRAVALCSSIRMVYLAFLMLARLRVEDVAFVDSVSTQIPLLRLRFPVLFYCHFPDLYLCTDRSSRLKQLYRAPLDWIEGFSTAAANLTVVNSRFTAGVYRRAFPSHPEPGVLYPAADFSSFTPPNWSAKKSDAPFVSLNRFERKKDIGLAIEALAQLPSSAQLVVAGGHDEAVVENVEYLAELKALAAKLGLSERVSFMPSVSDKERNSLLQSALCVIYTPENEHFGIVPIEAMYAGAPVLASASGGPLETVHFQLLAAHAALQRIRTHFLLHEFALHRRLLTARRGFFAPTAQLISEKRWLFWQPYQGAASLLVAEPTRTSPRNSALARLKIR